MHTSFAIYMYSPETKLSIQAQVCNFLGDFVGVLGGDDVLVEEKLMSFYVIVCVVLTLLLRCGVVWC